MTNQRFGGALVDIIDWQEDRQIRTDKHGGTRLVYHLTLSCGHRKLVQTRPEQRIDGPPRARCPVCKPPKAPRRHKKKICSGCGLERELHSRGLCKSCYKRENRAIESSNESQRKTDNAMREARTLLADLDAVVKETRPCGPRSFWR